MISTLENPTLTDQVTKPHLVGTQGIVLLAVGSPAYGKMAFNMAVSLKYHSPLVKVQLVHDDAAISHLNEWQKSLFLLTKIDKGDIEIGGGFAPAKGKLALYKYLLFDRSLYLDVDGVLIKDISPVFEEVTQKYHAQTSATFLWQEDNTKLKNHFGVDSVKPINSSFQYIEKSPEAESIYSEALAELEYNPMPMSEQTQKWYFGQPDELYMNVILARRNITPDFPLANPMFNRWKTETGPRPTFTDIKRGHYVIGFWGAPGNIWRSLYDMYNAEMQRYMAELFSVPHVYKMPHMMEAKKQKTTIKNHR